MQQVRNGSVPIFAIMLFIVFVGLASVAFSRIQGAEVVLEPTAPESNNFRFAAAGDFDNNDNADKVLRAIGASDADFTLALGDLGYVGNGNEHAWCEFVKERVGNDHPFQLVAGNHDDGSKDGDIQEYAKCLPNKVDTLVGDYAIEYYFDYKDLARFILISPDIQNYGYNYENGNEHLQWVIDAVSDARKNGIEWIILGMHKNCITPGEKTCEIGDDLLNTAIELKVDIILQGHEHAYFRSKQLALNPDTCPAIVVNAYDEKCVVDGDNELKKGAGTAIVISGAGGKELRAQNSKDPERDYFASINSSDSSASYGYSYFDVRKNVLKSSFVPAVGSFSDQFLISAN